MRYLISLLYKLYHFCLYKTWFKGLLYRSKIAKLIGNSIEFNKLYNTRIRFYGTHNNIILRGSIEGCHIIIEGDNNTLKIEEDSILQNCTIFLRGCNSNILIGEMTRIQSNGKIVCQGNHVFIKIGKECLFSENVDIWNSDTHKICDKNNTVINLPRSINIGDHVWLGKGCSVLKGVSIANNVVVGMNSVVTYTIPANCIAAGNPARILKKDITWNRDFVF